MKSICIIWIFTSIFFTLVSSQDSSNLEYPGEVKQVLGFVRDSNAAISCEPQLTAPGLQLIFPAPEEWQFVCGPEYFKGCNDQFFGQCVGNCTQDTYMQWVSAFSDAGHNYTCLYDYNKILGDAILADNMTCARGKNQGLEAFYEIKNMGTHIWNAGPLNCSDMDARIDRVTSALDKCQSKNIRKFIGEYFQAVVDASPCKGQIQVNSGPGLVTSPAVLLTATVLSSIVALLKF